jgi:hypothetical protein
VVCAGAGGVDEWMEGGCRLGILRVLLYIVSINGRSFIEGIFDFSRVESAAFKW